MEKEDVQPIKSRKILFDFFFYVFLIALIFTIPKYVIQRTVVEGSSMDNALHSGDHLIVEKVSMHFRSIKRFDIVVFYPYGKEKEEYYVKRVIGLPNETVEIRNGEILINDEVLTEEYGINSNSYSGIADEPILLGEEEYFLMGDNREISKDSRYEDIAAVPKENINGRVFFRVFPFNKIGLVD